LVEDSTGLLKVVELLYEAHSSADRPEARAALRRELFSAAEYAIGCDQVSAAVRCEIEGIMYQDANLGILWDTVSGADAHFSRKRPHDRIAYDRDGKPIPEK